VETLANRIEKTVQETDFSGVISVFENDSTVYNRAFGFRNVGENLPNNTNTAFGIASGTKFFTALGIGNLIDRGLISLNTKIRDIDKTFRKFIDEEATILHLLTHTSGVFDYYDEELIQDFDNYFVEIPWFQLETPSDYLSLFENQQMKYLPNQRYSYSNGGFVLLGIIIEKLTGTAYREFILDNILASANMQQSGFHAFNALPKNTASGYKKDRQTTNIYNLPIRGGGDGGMYTTTKDLRSFWQSLFSYNILSEDLTNEFLRTHQKFNNEKGYGCGIYKRLDDTMYSIVGGDAGVGFDSRYMPNRNLTANILSNMTNGEEDLAKIVLEHIEKGI
jgi:CubicO group peptidase (beta-lactamase class C family)